MRRSLGIAGLLIAAVSWGCGDEGDGEEETIDSSVIAGDSGSKADTGTGANDAGGTGTPDSGPRADASVVADAGGQPGGGTDAGSFDAGGATDSGAGGDGGATDSGGSTSDSGARDSGVRDGGGGGDAGTGATFTRVYASFSGCTSCHGEREAEGGLDMRSKSTAYTELTTPGNAEGQMCMSNNRKRVIANDPDNSLLLKKLSGTQDCGGRMPAGGRPALSAAQIAEVRSWIAAGALNN